MDVHEHLRKTVKDWHYYDAEGNPARGSNRHGGFTDSCAFTHCICYGAAAIAAGPLLAEVERLRAKNRELNRRATRAEGQVATTIEDCRRQGVSVGRGLANVGYEMVARERDRYRDALETLRVAAREACARGDEGGLVLLDEALAALAQEDDDG